MAEKKSGYVGKIANTGTQMVKAPNQVTAKGGKAVVKTGKELRK